MASDSDFSDAVENRVCIGNNHTGDKVSRFLQIAQANLAEKI